MNDARMLPFDWEGTPAAPAHVLDPAVSALPVVPPPPVLSAPAVTWRELRSPARLLLVALGLGGIADALFWGQLPGLGALVFALFALVALLGLAWNEGNAGGRPGGRRPALLLIAPLILFFTGMVAVRDSGMLVFLDVAAALFLTGHLVVLFAGDRLMELGLAELFGIPWLALGSALGRAARPLAALSQRFEHRSEGRRRAAAVLRGLVIAAPLLALLLPLLLSADPVFARDASDLFQWLFPEEWGERAGHAALVLGVAWLAAGGLTTALTRVAAAPDERAAAAPKRPLGFVEGMTPLVLIAALFGAFVAVQFSYLFGGSARVQAIPGLTCAAYARQGFAELVTVAALTLAIAVLWQRILRRESAAQERAFHAALTVLVGLTGVLLLSAHQRMAAYEAAYGATAMRLYVDAFIVFLGLVLGWLVAALWTRTERRFAFGALVCGLGCLAWLNVRNPDAFVMQTNIARAIAGRQPLDGVVWSLSDDAVPVLCAHLDRLTGADRRLATEALAARLRQRGEERSWTSWPSWNLSRRNAYKAIQHTLTKRK